MEYRSFAREDFDQLADERPLVVLDIGYSEKRASTGLTWTGRERATNHRFGVAIRHTAQALNQLREHNPILVLEAPLSQFHNDRGNPGIRGEFERGRGWYHQPAASVCLGVLRFLDQLRLELKEWEQLLVAEAFLSNKAEKTSHCDDALLIESRFWQTESEILREGVAPLSPWVKGIPNVHVF